MIYQIQDIGGEKTPVPVSGTVATDSVTKNDMHPVTSNAVAESKSYSTTETLTGGTWIDGKPIYRKVFTGLNYGNVTVNTWYNLGITITNINKLIYARGLRTQDYLIPDCIYRKATNGIEYLMRYAIANLDVVIVEYTKN